MAATDKTIAKMKASPHNVRFEELVAVCERYFGTARQKGTSHQVFQTPWEGDPRINIQDKKGLAKASRSSRCSRP